MTTFNYSSGDPSDLTGGAPASMSDISGPLADLVTFLNGNIDTANLATSAKPVTVLGAYRIITEVSGQVVGENIGTKLFGTTSTSLHVGPVTSGLDQVWAALFPFDPADFSVSGLSTKLRLRVLYASNATAPALDFTFGLYPVTVAGGNTVVAATAGTVVSGSTVAVSAPPASTATVAVGSDFSPPSAGTYGLGVVISGTQAAQSAAVATVQLQLHHV